MGLTDKIFKKEDEKSKREVGDNFDKSEADRIFDALDNVKAKKKRDTPEYLKKEMDKTKEVSVLIDKAQNLMMSEKFGEAIPLFKKAIVIMPESSEAYIGLADIYSLQKDKDSEIDILKSGISNVNNSKDKNELIKRLKKLNN